MEYHVLPEKDAFGSVEELDRWYNRFKSLTYYQRKISNDKSIEQYGANNDVRYQSIRAEFLKDISATDDNVPDDDQKFSDNVRESYINESSLSDVITELSPSEWEHKIEKAKRLESMGYIFVVDTREPIIMPLDYGYHNLNEINRKWELLQGISSSKRVIYNSTAKDIFGLDNDNLHKVFNNILEDREIEFDLGDIRYNFRYDKDEDILDGSITEQLLINENTDLTTKIKSSIITKPTAKKDEKLRPEPYFTPDEMRGFGVFSGEINFYSPRPDNDTLSDNRTVMEWFKDYEDSNGSIIPNQYEWSRKLKELYVDYNKIIESGDIDKINSRKQSILELGWNPEINYTDDIASNLDRKEIPHVVYSNVEKFYDAYKNASKPIMRSYFNDNDIVPLYILQKNKPVDPDSGVIEVEVFSYFSDKRFRIITTQKESLCYYIDAKDTSIVCGKLHCIFIRFSDWQVIFSALINNNLKDTFRLIRDRYIGDYQDINIPTIFVFCLMKLLNMAVLSDIPIIYIMYTGYTNNINMYTIINMTEDIIARVSNSAEYNTNKDLSDMVMDKDITIKQMKEYCINNDYEDILRALSCSIMYINNKEDEYLNEFSFNDLDKQLYSITEAFEGSGIKPFFLVFVGGRKLSSQIIRGATRSKYSHAAIAMYPSLTKIYSFNMDYINDTTFKKKARLYRGFTIESVMQYIKQDPKMNLCVKAVLIKEDMWSKIRNTLNWYVTHKNQTKYNFSNLIRVVFRKIQKTETVTKMICSQFVYTILKQIGMESNLDKKAINLVTPQDLYKLDKVNIITVYEGKVGGFNKNMIEKKLNAISKSIQIPKEIN